VKVKLKAAVYQGDIERLVEHLIRKRVHSGGLGVYCWIPEQVSEFQRKQGMVDVTVMLEYPKFVQTKKDGRKPQGGCNG